MESDELRFDGKIYISSKRAADLTGYTKDYIGQLARGHKIDAKLVGRNWYINESSLLEHKSNGRKNKQDMVQERIKKQEALLGKVNVVNENKDATVVFTEDDRPLIPLTKKNDTTVTQQEEQVLENENKEAGDTNDTIVPITVKQQPTQQSSARVQDASPVRVTNPTVPSFKQGARQPVAENLMSDLDTPSSPQASTTTKVKSAKSQSRALAPKGGIPKLALAAVIVLALLAAGTLTSVARYTTTGSAQIVRSQLTLSIPQDVIGNLSAKASTILGKASEI